MKTLITWMSEHPLKSCGFTSLFTFLAALIATCENIFWPSLLWMVSLVCLLAVMNRDLRKMLVVVLLGAAMLAESLPLQAAEKPEPGAPLVVTIVVVVVGTTVVIILVRTCQRLFNRPPRRLETNAEPFLISAASQSSDYAASWTYYPVVSCEIAPASVSPITAMEVTGSFQPTTNGLEFRLSATKQKADESLVDSVTFGQLIAEHGIRLGSAPGQQFFGRDGQSATQAEVPIYFWAEDGEQHVSVASDEASVSVAVERSPDLTRWETLSTAQISTGHRLRFLDATAEGQMFYRFRAL